MSKGNLPYPSSFEREWNCDVRVVNRKRMHSDATLFAQRSRRSCRLRPRSDSSCPKASLREIRLTPVGRASSPTMGKGVLVRMPLLATCWSCAGPVVHLDEPLIPTCACTGNQGLGLDRGRCCGIVARQRYRTRCATAVCAIRSPAHRSGPCAAYPIWSSFHSSTRRSGSAGYY